MPIDSKISDTNHRTRHGFPVDDIDTEQRRSIVAWFQRMNTEGRLPENVAWAVKIQIGFDPLSGEKIEATTTIRSANGPSFFGCGLSWVTGEAMAR
jgi:hypothetical protein